MEKLDNDGWGLVKISEVNDKIIRKLVDNLKLDLSDEFFMSFESIIKLGKKAESILKSTINEMDRSNKFKKEIFNFLLNVISTNKLEDPLILKLFHHDFIVRVQAIKYIEKNKDLKYVDLILALIKDPDDSVRVAVINLLVSLNQIKNPLIYNTLKSHINYESNLIIQKKLKKILNDF